ncbi:hypothetical protein FJZ48_01350 [Candidatus Uhrbacteria bacterium]|nr:hypothetical protein [Candidatus Uhrbacteria bacterium]
MLSEDQLQDRKSVRQILSVQWLHTFFLVFVSSLVVMRSGRISNVQAKLDSLEHQISVEHAQQQAKLVQQIYDDAKQDQEICDKEVKRRSALIDSQKILNALDPKPKSAGEQIDREIGAVLEPYRECLQRRAKERLRTSDR